jgi:TPR repeat protein
MTLPPATIISVPINDYAEANDELKTLATEIYYSCCGKSVCCGCIHSFRKSGNMGRCPYCQSDREGKTDEDCVEEIMRRVEVNDADAIYMLGNYYHHGEHGLLPDREKALELWTQAAKIGSSQAHFHLGNEYRQRGDSKKAKFHYEAAAMAGHEATRSNLGSMEAQSGNMERAVKHWKIAGSAGDHNAMRNLLVAFNQGLTDKDTIDSSLRAYNTSCTKMRSDARDAAIRSYIVSIGEK